MSIQQPTLDDFNMPNLLKSSGYVIHLELKTSYMQRITENLYKEIYLWSFLTFNDELIIEGFYTRREDHGPTWKYERKVVQ